jgi:SnoaL-like domain
MTQQSLRTETLLRRIDELESRNAICDLVTDYCRGFDSRSFGRLLSIWSDDCVCDIGPPYGKYEGHPGMIRAVNEVLWPVWRESHHLTSNLKVEFSGTDTANGVCDVDCMGALRDDTVQMISATHSDRFERRDGVWKINYRGVVIHCFNPIPGTIISSPPMPN